MEAVSGVWPLRILNAYTPMHPAVPAASVHGNGPLPKRLEPFRAQVLPLLHRSHDGGEYEEVPLLTTQKGVRLEEGNHSLQEVLAPSDHVHEARVRRAANDPSPST